MTRFARGFLLLLILGASARASAASLRVSPARFLLQEVKPGKEHDIYAEAGLRIAIYNDDATTRTWFLSAHRPSARGRWEKGYGEIPDPRWCRFDKSEIVVGPKTAAYAHLFLNIPAEEKYYNQRWVATFGIDGKPGAGGIALAADIRAQIETQSKADMKTRPDGPLGLKPGVIRFEGATSGSGEEARATLYNNDDKAREFKISSIYEDGAIDAKNYLTASYSPIPDTHWIEREKKIWIEAGGSAELILRLKIPPGAAEPNQKREDILFIEPEEGPAAFLRVRVHPPARKRTD